LPPGVARNEYRAPQLFERDLEVSGGRSPSASKSGIIG
jgi:hypothetical protein